MGSDAEIEIDLRKYIEILLHYWYLIAGTTIVVALAVYIWQSIQPQTYQADALVAITKSQYILNFDPRITTMSDTTQAYKAYVELAKSNDLLQGLLDQLDTKSGSFKTVGDLSNALNAKSGDDPSLVRLQVQSRDPDEAARVANLWAETFISRANEIYGTQSLTPFQSFKTQAASAEKDLAVAEQTLIDYQTHDQSLTLQNELSSTLQMQSDYLTDQRNTTYLLRDVAVLREQLGKQPAQNPSNLANRLTVLFLQVKAYKAQTDVPIQLQFNSSDAVVTTTVSDQIAFLDSLSSSLQTQLGGVDARLKELEPRVLSLQQKLQQISMEKDRLTRTRDVSRQTLMTLLQKVEERRIALEVDTGGVKLVSHAAAPEAPISSRKLVNIILAGMAGLVLSVFTVFLIDWLRNRTRN